MGPRTTSMRSMAETGGIKLVCVSLNPFGVMSPALFWRRPSIRIRVYSLGIPRMLIFMPPVLPTLASTSTPSISVSASARLLNRFCSSSSRVMTEMLAGASLTSCAKPEAVTTSGLICVGALEPD